MKEMNLYGNYRDTEQRQRSLPGLLTNAVLPTPSAGRMLPSLSELPALRSLPPPCSTIRDPSELNAFEKNQGAPSSVLVSQPKQENTNDTMVTSGPAPPHRKKRIRIKTERRREQCRANQARYRNKLRHGVTGLESAVGRLRDEVFRLNARRDFLYNTVNTRDAAINTTIEMFRVFAHGLSRPSSDERGLIYSYQHQLNFVNSFMAPNLRLDDLIGSQHLIEQIRRFTVYYDGIQIDVNNLEPIIGPETTATIKAGLTMGLTITPATINYVFPHLRQPEYHEISRKLLGRRSICQASAVCEYDGNHLVAIDWTVDFISTLLTHLSVTEVSIVLQDAQIVRDAYLSGDDSKEDMNRFRHTNEQSGIVEESRVNVFEYEDNSQSQSLEHEKVAMV